MDWRGRGGYVVAPAPVGHRNRQRRGVDPLAAAERCGLLAEEPRQTHRTLASGRQVGLAHPGRPRQPTSPERTHPSPIPTARAASD